MEQMLLSDGDIRRVAESGLIEPWCDDQLQPASYDVLLSDRLLVRTGVGEVDPRSPQQSGWEPAAIPASGFLLAPWQFVLGSTVERFKFPHHLAGRLDGKSSVGRLGIVVHITAGFFDPGFEGDCTLEILNVAGAPVRLYPRMPIAQMSFLMLTSSAQKPYGHHDRDSKYQDQSGPVESRYSRNFS